MTRKRVIEVLEADQMVNLGKALARTVTFGPGWVEPLNGDDIERLVIAFVQELAEYHGETKDVFVQEVLGLRYIDNRQKT